MNFIGRNRELGLLHKILDVDGMKVSLIYGRRRVGKSSLIREALKTTSSKWIYYEAKQTTELNNIESLSYLLSDLLDLPKLGFNSLEQYLKFLFEKAKKEKLILVIDEYPYLRKAIKGFDSIIQVLIDQYRETSKLKLIICGSMIDIMKELLYVDNPLYGRIDLTINLLPMDYYESSLFYEKYSFEDRVRLYSVFGGIPYYNQLIDQDLSVKENIVNLIASPDASLKNEISINLLSEISKLTNANEVFETLAKGFSRFNDILSQSHVSSSPSLVDVLDKLIKMELVQKVAPINDPNNKRKTGYYISDQLSLFYYRYCFRYSSQFRVMDPTIFYDRYIHQDFEYSYVPKIFEEISKQYLIRKNIRGEIEPIFDLIGKYWYDDPLNKMNGEFDLVTLDQNGYTFYEVKFKDRTITQSMIDQEIYQVKKTGLKCYRYGFIARVGFDNGVKENDQLLLLTLDDIYS